MSLRTWAFTAIAGSGLVSALVASLVFHSGCAASCAPVGCFPEGIIVSVMGADGPVREFTAHITADGFGAVEVGCALRETPDGPILDSAASHEWCQPDGSIVIPAEPHYLEVAVSAEEGEGEFSGILDYEEFAVRDDACGTCRVASVTVELDR